MLLKSKLQVAIAMAVAVVVIATVSRTVQAKDLVHEIQGVVKSVDKDSKTMVVKTEDGTEHTIKWTDKTTVKGGKDVGDSISEGTKVSVKYSEEGGEKTAVAVKHAGKSTAKAME